jgi:hypothetical protein
MAEESSGSSNFIWAIAMIIIVAILAGMVYYSGMLGGAKKHEVDIDIKAPATSR